MIPLILVVTAFAAGCEDDPILGPTDQEPDGGSYGIIHFERSSRADSSAAAGMGRFLTENPRRF